MFEKLKAMGNEKIRETESKDSQESLPPTIIGMRAAEAAKHYHQALSLQGLTLQQKASLHKNLSRAYEIIEGAEEDCQLKMFHFDRSIEHADRALYFGCGNME